MSTVHRWIRRLFILWAIVAMSWLINSMRTRGVDPSALRAGSTVSVTEGKTTLQFIPTRAAGGAGLVFICGSGVSAEAYVPLLRPLADAGYPVFIVKLPYRFAPFDSHKDEAVRRVRDTMASHPQIPRWVVAGHSLGAALAARVVRRETEKIGALVLVGTTHPKDFDLSSLQIPVTKIYASSDGVAPPDRVLAGKRLLPAHTNWIEIQGGNHSQFGHYGHQLMDGRATISREQQQSITRAALLDALNGHAAGSRTSNVAPPVGLL